jgi:hypothetical protein
MHSSQSNVILSKKRMHALPLSQHLQRKNGIKMIQRLQKK